MCSRPLMPQLERLTRCWHEGREFHLLGLGCRLSLNAGGGVCIGYCGGSVF
jgi:hypothetical protein